MDYPILSRIPFSWWKGAYSKFFTRWTISPGDLLMRTPEPEASLSSGSAFFTSRSLLFFSSNEIQIQIEQYLAQTSIRFPISLSLLLLLRLNVRPTQARYWYFQSYWWKHIDASSLCSLCSVCLVFTLCLPAEWAGSSQRTYHLFQALRLISMSQNTSCRSSWAWYLAWNHDMRHFTSSAPVVLGYHKLQRSGLPMVPRCSFGPRVRFFLYGVPCRDRKRPLTLSRHVAAELSFTEVFCEFLSPHFGAMFV